MTVYEPNTFVVLATMRLNVLTEEALEHYPDNERDQYEAGIRDGRVIFEPFEQDGESWLRIVVADRALLAVALLDLLPELKGTDQ